MYSGQDATCGSLLGLSGPLEGTKCQLQTNMTLGRGFCAVLMMQHLALALGCASPRSTDAEVIRVPDEPMCSSCRIETSELVTLEVPPDTTDGLPTMVRIDRQSRYWVLRRTELPAVFSESGELIAILGRLGRGPGEYEQPWSVLILNDDSLLILDENRRGTIVDATLKAIGFVRLPMALHQPVVVSWPRTVVGSGAIPYQESAGPLYHLNFEKGDGEVVRQFRVRDLDDPSLHFLTWHHFSSPERGSFWATWERQYDLALFNSDLTRTRLLERRPEWFSSVSPMSYDWRNDPPVPLMGGVEQDAGLLLAYVHVARRNWREGWPEVPAGVHEVPARYMALDRLYETRLEIIDAKKARVVASTTVPRYLINPLPDGRAAFFEQDERGGRIVVLKFALRR